MIRLRLVLLSLLIAAIMASYSPPAREQARQAWQSIQPGVVQIMDVFYILVRGVIVGDHSDDQMEVEPSSPGGDFERVVT